MKGSKWFIIGIVVLLAVVLVLEVKIPRRYSWDESYEHNNVQPFGCYVMDSILSASVTQGYSVTGRTLPQLLRDSTDATIIYVDDYMELTSIEYEALDALLERGNNVMLIAGDLYSNVSAADSAVVIKRGITWKSSSYFSFGGLENYVNGQKDYYSGTLRWTGAMGAGKARDFENVPSAIDGGSLETDAFKSKTYSSEVYTPDPDEDYDEEYDEDYNEDDVVAIDDEPAETSMAYGTIEHDSPYDDLENTVLVECIYDDAYNDQRDKQLKAVASRRMSQRGTLFVVTMPLLFSNYGFLHDETRSLAMRLLSVTGDKPIVRYDPSLGDGMADGASSSPLRYLLDNAPLRWAVYLTLVAILLAMVFTARRRQRVIPVIKAPENRALQLVEHMGLYYYSRHNNVDLIAKRYRLFTANVRRSVLLDITDDDRDEVVNQLAYVTGFDKKQLAADLDYIREAASLDRDEAKVGDDVMRYCIDVMERIEKAASIVK